MDSLQSFEDFDKSMNESVSKVLASFAKVAEENPEEIFGLKATQRDRFFVEALLNPSVLRALSGSTSEADEGVEGVDSEDVTGGNPALLGLLGKAISSDAGAKIAEELLNHIRSEKNFIKETGSEIVSKVGGWFE